MLNISESIILGVVSGISTSFVIWICIKIFNRIIIPWYQSITYLGIKIDGTWLGFITSFNSSKKDEDANFEILIDQKGHKIKGEITVLKNSDGTSDTKLLVFDGILKDGNLVLSYVAKDKTRMGTGCFVFKLENDAQDLVGKCLYISSLKGNVAESEQFWRRKKLK